MESTNIESQEPVLHDHTEFSSNLKKQGAAPQSSFHCTPYRDSTFTFLFLTALVTTFTFGIIASTRTDDTLTVDTKLRLSKYNPTTNKCEIAQPPPTPKASDSVPPDSDFAFVTLVSLASLSALALPIPLILLLVSLLRRYPHALVVLSAPFMSLLLLAFGLLGGLLWFSRCLSSTVPEVWLVVLGGKEISDALFALCTPTVMGYWLWEMWTGSFPVENGVEVMRRATEFWREHLVLLVVNPMLLAGAMVVVNRPIFTLMWNVSSEIGEIVPDFDVVNDPAKECGDFATGSRCCRQERPGWGDAYVTCASFMVFWVIMVSMILQHSVVSGTVSLWYFAPKGSSAIARIKRSLGNAYGPSFGTACNLGTMVTTMVVAPVKFLKGKLSDKILKSDRQGMMSSILRGCFSWMSLFPEHSPQLPSIFLGIPESSQPNLLKQALPISTGMSNFKDLTVHTIWGMFVTSTLGIIFSVRLELDYSNAFVWIAVAYCFPIIVIGLATGFFLAIFSVIKSVSVCYALEKDLQ